MKTYILIILSMLNSMVVAQTYNYGYDGSGNRTSRFLTYPRIANNGGNPEAVNEQTGAEELGTLSEALEVELADTRLSIFPNPARHVVNVSFSTGNQITEEVRILDTRGKVLYKTADITGNIELPFEAYPPGYYFIWLKLDGKIERFQIIKE